MKKLTVGKRIILGFTCLIIIMVFLGLVAIVKMQSVFTGVHRLESEDIPKVSLSSDVERNLLHAMFENRGFGYTQDTAYYQSGKEYAKQVLDSLEEASKLATSEDIPSLKESVGVIRQNAMEYFQSVEESKKNVESLSRYRDTMRQSADDFMEITFEMISNQEDVLNYAVDALAEELALLRRVMALVEEARVCTYKARATGDMEHAARALANVESAREKLTELARVTTAKDREAIDNLGTEIARYGNEIETFKQESDKGEFADAKRLDEIFGAMDQSAEEIVHRTDGYLEAQMARLDMDIKDRINKIKWLNNLIETCNVAMVDNYRAQAQRDPVLMRSAIATIEEMHEIFEKLEPVCMESWEIASVETIDEADHELKEAMSGFVDTFLKMQGLNAKRLELASAALTLANEQARDGTLGTLEFASDSANEIDSASSMLIIGLLLAAGIGGTMAYFITTSINRPLTSAITGLSIGAGETRSASTQVSSASQSLAEGASEQAASLEETSSSMEEMTSMVARNLEVARKTNRQAQDARSAADAGVQSMGELRERADVVSASAVEMESAMQAIKQSSDSISKIIKTIDEIAFQTNILALNAAVEAARAGEAGAGFAVVADEVRSLARRAAEAAQETASMIEDSMERSDRGVRVNETVGRNLKDVLDKASQVEDGLKSISSVVGGVNEAMNELEASVKEQQDGITQINTAVNQVNEVTQNNAASAEEAASAAEQMNAQSVNLTEIVAILNEMVTGKREGDNRAQKPVARSSGFARKVPRRVETLSSNGIKRPMRNGSGRTPEKRPSSSMESTFSLPGDFE